MSSDGEVFEFSKEDIALRIADTWQLAEDFIDGFLQDENFPRPRANLIINKRLLLLATESAYQDIARYKNYHQKDPKNDKLDCVKRAAFVTKWFIRFKPILSVGLGDGDSEADDVTLDDLELANEFFCIYFFENHLSVDIGIDVMLSDTKTRELVYDLLYRQITVDGWIAIYQLIKDCCFPNMVPGTPFVDML